MRGARQVERLATITWSFPMRLAPAQHAARGLPIDAGLFEGVRDRKEVTSRWFSGTCWRACVCKSRGRVAGEIFVAAMGRRVGCPCTRSSGEQLSHIPCTPTSVLLHTYLPPTRIRGLQLYRSHSHRTVRDTKQPCLAPPKSSGSPWVQLNRLWLSEVRPAPAT